MRPAILFLYKATMWSSTILLALHSNANPGFVYETTYVLDKSQYPVQLKQYAPSTIYIFISHFSSAKSPKPVPGNSFTRGDTITNLKGFLDPGKAISGYRLLFGSSGRIDSVWHVWGTNSRYRIKEKAYPAGDGLLHIVAFDTASRIVDQFVYKYGQKYKDELKPVPTLDKLFRMVIVYDRIDRNYYAASSAWVLSIGIDEYKGDRMMRLLTCESDAKAYNDFFKTQFAAFSGGLTGIHEYILTGKNATKTNILNTLKEIAAGASPNDYFIFNFNGMSTVVTFDSVTYSTYFLPYDTAGYNDELLKKFAQRIELINDRLISMKVLQEHIQLIGARNQLFISEAGPSDKFKTEFIKTMMQNSPTLASLLDVNRVIIVPDHLGYDGFTCRGKRIDMAPITYSITSLDSSLNIFHLFSNDYRSAQVASAVRSVIDNCKMGAQQYFEVFFERKFLQQYKEIFGDEGSQTRGGNLTNKQVQKAAGITGKRHALVIGTDHYKGKGWDKLQNPVYDATEVADILKGFYDYEVQLLKDPPMDSIYKAIRDYYRTLQPDDQLIIYVAGHGDYDKDLLDDGFIVCSDSRSVEDDPLRNSYIQHTKLKKMINKIPAKQILVMLDICHGGVFDEEVRENPASRITNRNLLEALRENAAYSVRKMLSSVGLEAAFDGKAGKHSPFASYLISILNARGGLEGYVTVTDIFALLRKASLNETATLKISPHLAGFGDNNPLGEFFLLPIDSKTEKKEPVNLPR